MSDVKEYEYFDELSAELNVARFPVKNAALRTDKGFVIKWLEEFGEQYSEAFERMNPELDIKNYFHIIIDYDKANNIEGKIINIQELWGEGYDITTKKTSLYNYGENCLSGSINSGLAYALLDPPYGIQRPSKIPSELTVERKEPEEKWMSELVERFNEEVLKINLDSSIDHIVIEEWPVDWSNYFDAGKEWWGSFLWSILDTKHNWVTIIGASTTD